MKAKTTQREIRNLLKYGEALPLSDAARLIETGKADYYQFENILYSIGVYGINGLAIRDTKTGQVYADAARTSNVFYFHRF